MNQLNPRLVVLTGIGCVGKSKTIDWLVKNLSNAFVLDKDTINQAMLHVPLKRHPELQDFEQYVERDGIFPDNARHVETPFGEMARINPKNAFYVRHARDQGYLVMAGIAAINLSHGKIPILDNMTHRNIKDGSLRRFMEQPIFGTYPRYHIHVISSEKDLYRRMCARAETDEEARIRDAEKIKDREIFHRFVTLEQQMIPEELKQGNYLLVNTSEGSPQACAERCLEYISK